MRRCAPRRWLLVCLVLLSPAGGQFQFEIPADMLGQMMGGGGGRGQGPKGAEWPKTENSEITAENEWLVNTEWEGKTSKYLLLRDGLVESPLKECEHEGHCLWAANNGRVLINTPKLKVVRFTVEGLDKVDRKKIEQKDEAELKKLELVSEKPSKSSGKKGRLGFKRIAVADDSDSIISADLYKLLDLTEDAEQSSIKSKFRRLSVQHHPDKGGDPKIFNEMREAYEVLGDAEKRRQYNLGGMQLVKNVELAWKEVEGQKAQVDAQLNQVPKNHPQYQMFKAQIEQQKKQFEKANVEGQIQQKLQSDELEVMVPVSAEELYNGVEQKKFIFPRLMMCRGCREDPERPECKDCGRCPPEKVQVPKYGMTPFGKQVIGMSQKEQESRERCREVGVEVPLKISKGAKQGATLKVLSNMGHQTPGKFPGKVKLLVQRGSKDDSYRIAESDLHTVLHLSLEQALFGFSISWQHLGEETITIKRDRLAHPDEVLKLKGKGLVESGSKRGDLYVRLAVDLPEVAKGEKALSLSATSGDKEAKLVIEDEVRLEDGTAWRDWKARSAAKVYKVSKGKSDEL
mmetsp:Transcript_5664/g.10110  ORF Transcript_5664/g.10110 Transcript_5664/m.10110 type:complete len:572 (+) Transcript_5664:85-1800(+)